MPSTHDEIVLDANVLAHACNPGCEYFDSALAIITTLIDSGSKIALDDTGKVAPDQWTSNLYREYMDCVPPLSISATVLRHLLDAGRVIFYRRPSRETWKACCLIVPKNNNDAIVLGIGTCASSKSVVSNDYADFSVKARAEAKKRLGVRFYDSDEYAA